MTANNLLPLQGLGKILQSLMLILAHPLPASWPVLDLDKNMHDKSEVVLIKTPLIMGSCFKPNGVAFKLCCQCRGWGKPCKA